MSGSSTVFVSLKSTTLPSLSPRLGLVDLKPSARPLEHGGVGPIDRTGAGNDTDRDPLQPVGRGQVALVATAVSDSATWRGSARSGRSAVTTEPKQPRPVGALAQLGHVGDLTG